MNLEADVQAMQVEYQRQIVELSARCALLSGALATLQKKFDTVEEGP